MKKLIALFILLGLILSGCQSDNDGAIQVTEQFLKDEFGAKGYQYMNVTRSYLSEDRQGLYKRYTVEADVKYNDKLIPMVFEAQYNYDEKHWFHTSCTCDKLFE